MGVIDEVKQKLDIVQVVSDSVKLQKAGRNYKAPCPFHSEKNPSFFVFPEKQSWHCFGACGSGGDIFSFIMKKEGVDFAQALRLLANKAGVPLVNEITPKRQAQNKERDQLFEINETAAAYFHHILLHTSTAEAAKGYITRRGLSIETVKDFQIGYAPEGWDTLKQYLHGKGCTEAEMLNAGLLVERDGKNNYDRFRNRLMFPIRDIQGKVTGFGGRALDDSLPKYLNSPQTLVFDKSSSLYGINRAKTAIKDKGQAVIVEGYMDVLAAHQYGYRNVVASMGTAMTDKQLTILKGLTRNLILALDADAAGEEAVSRSGEMIDKMLPVPPSFYGWVKYEDAYNAEVRIMVLPAGKDPDEVIIEDSSQWQELLTNAKPMVDFIFEKASKQFDLSSDTGKSLAVEKLLPLLYQMTDPIRQGHYTERLAQLLKIDFAVLGDALKKFKVNERKRKTYKDLRSSTSVIPTFSSSAPLEQYSLALLLQYPELKSDIAKLSPEYFENTENRELFEKWRHSDNIDSLRNNLDSILQEYLDNLITRTFRSIITENESARHEIINECIIRLKERRLRTLESQKQEILAIEAEIGGTAAQLAKLDEQGIEIAKQLYTIERRFDRRHQQAKSDEK
jgi:DNA primase